MMQPETNFPKYPTCLGCGHPPHGEGGCGSRYTFTKRDCLCTIETIYLAKHRPPASAL